MDIETLRGHIRALAALEADDAPVLSCYLDVEGGYRDELGARVRVLRRRLAGPAHAAFEEALWRIEIFLGSQQHPGTRGTALFARGGRHHFLLPLQFQVPLPNRIVMDAMPHVYGLVELEDTYHRYMVLIAALDHVRILEVSLGEVTRELWLEQPGLGATVGNRSTREHHQPPRRDRSTGFIEEAIAVLDRIVAQGGHTHLILAGNPDIASRLRAALPRRLGKQLIDVVPSSTSDRLADIVAATLSRFIDREEEESLEAVALLVQQLRRNDLAVCGTEPSLEALASGQVDQLVMAGSYQPAPGWECAACGAPGLGPAPTSCPRCGGPRCRPVDLREKLVRLAELQGCHIELVRHSDRLMEVGGVGCLLRFVPPGGPDWRPRPASAPPASVRPAPGSARRTAAPGS